MVEDPEVVEAALEAVAQIKDPRFIPYITSLLHNKSVRRQAGEALNAFGPEVPAMLKQMVEDQEIAFHNVLFIPDVLQRMGTPGAIEVLVGFIDQAEYSLSIKAIEALRKVRTEKPELHIDRELIARKILEESRTYLNLLSFLHTQITEHEKDPKTKQNERIREARQGLITILEHRVDGHLDRIFNLLGIHYFEEDVEPILKLAVSGDESQRANAIEFIDNMLESRLRHTLLPIIDALSDGVVYSEDLVSKLKLPSYTERECFETLISRHDVKIKHAVLYLIGQLGEGSYAPLAEKLLDSRFETVRNQAKQVLESLQVPRT
jgi:AAA family ATP:ADP antiporter